MGSGQLEVPTLGAFPRPSQEGQRVLKKLPKGIWVPETCRMIEQSLAEPAPEGDHLCRHQCAHALSY